MSWSDSINCTWYKDIISDQNPIISYKVRFLVSYFHKQSIRDSWLYVPVLQIASANGRYWCVRFYILFDIMADFGWYSLADMSWLYPKTANESSNEYHIWKCWYCKKIDRVADSNVWIELCIVCYQDLPMV